MTRPADPDDGAALLRKVVRACRKRRRRVKLVDSTGASLNGVETLTRALALRAILRRHLADDEARVGVMLPPTVAAAVTNLALAFDRRTLVNLNYSLTGATVNRCAELAGLRHVVTSRRFLDRLPFTLDVPMILLEDLAPEATAKDKATAALLAVAAPLPVLERAVGFGAIRRDDPLAVVFTSGTTGDPKGIAYTQAQLCLAIDAIADAFPFVGPGSRLLCWLPLSNLFQRMVNLAGMRRGAASYLLGDPRRVMDVVAGVSPDVFIGVPRFYEKLYQGIQARIAALPPLQRRLALLAWETGRRAAACRLEKKPTPPGLALAHRLLDRTVLSRIRRTMGTRLRCMVTGSAPTPEYLLRDFYALGWLLLESYGLSENVLPMAMNRIDDFEFGTVGRPVPGNDIRVSDDGVIAVRGPGVFGGYLTGAAAPSPVAGDYFQTADIGSFDEQGCLRLLGRIDEVVKTSTGKRIQLNAIEAVLRGVPGVVDAVVVAGGRRFPVAVCTTELSPRPAAVAQALEARLAAALTSLPADHRPPIVLISDKPFSVLDGELTSNLKVRRQAVEQRFEPRIAAALSQFGDPGEAGRNPVVVW